MNQNLRLQMRLDEDTATKLDELRRRDPELPTRTEMVRRLIHAAFEQLDKRNARS
jgi:hypothetical protein